MNDCCAGNGNAVLFANESRVFTFSMHCKENYFSPKQRSNVDIELEAGMGDVEYLSILKVWLPYLLDVLKPQLIFFQAGLHTYICIATGTDSPTQQEWMCTRRTDWAG